MSTPTRTTPSSDDDGSISPPQNQATRSSKEPQDSSAELKFERVSFEPRNSSTRVSVEKDVLTMMLGNEEFRARLLEPFDGVSSRQ